MNRGRWIGLTAILVLALGAGTFVLRRAAGLAGDAPPNSADTATYWYCRKCGRGFGLTAAEYSQKVRLRQATDLTAGGPTLLGRTEASVACPICGSVAGAAFKCVSDETIFEARLANGERGVCPTCGWSPMSR